MDTDEVDIILSIVVLLVIGVIVNQYRIDKKEINFLKEQAYISESPVDM